jgi:uncharacterized protein
MTWPVLSCLARRNPLKLLAALAVFGSGPAHADVKAGVDAWSRGDYPLAVREWRGPADKGDADALFNLGQAYKLGRGVKADLGRAETLFGQAAAKGHLHASDLYGLLLFQRGERERAIPYVIAAAERGEPRAQYLLGVAHFNGDAVPKDWVRAYALTSLAVQADVPQAKNALARMDSLIPLAQRQQAAALAPDLASQAQATRARQLAAIDLGATAPDQPARPEAVAARPIPRAAQPRAQSGDAPRTAGADFARPQIASRPSVATPQPSQVARPLAKPAAAAQALAAPATRRYSVQLGAFSVAGNAEALWNRLKDRTELAGTSRQLIDAGRVTRLLATGFDSRSAAEAACAKLASAGIGCLVPRN